MSLRENSILHEADKIIYGDREKTYGDPAKNLRLIANMWSAYLGRQGDDVLTPADVCQMMILLKVARLNNDPEHKDSLVDQAGYAALHQRVMLAWNTDKLASVETSVQEDFSKGRANNQGLPDFL